MGEGEGLTYCPWADHDEGYPGAFWEPEFGGAGVEWEGVDFVLVVVFVTWSGDGVGWCCGIVVIVIEIIGETETKTGFCDGLFEVK